jgi:photosystem II stability/assembly factor-like uncharacterized protein
MYNRLLTLGLIFFTFILYGQDHVKSSSASDRKSYSKWNEDALKLVSGMNITNIGPTIMSGRISDIDVNPSNPTEFYVSYASGGLWHTKNNGTTFTPIFDKQAVMTIGAFAVHWESRTIYVGTGEANSSRSSYAGNGIYKSEDNGKSWKHLGLDESHHVGQIWIDALDVNHVVICALGHLYSTNTERGIYTTIDGGNTWKQSLYIDENTGAVDMLQDPLDAKTLYASTWHRERRAWNFIESGKTSSIYKSIDGGFSWFNIAKPGSGFPTGDGNGRIGLSVSKKDNVNYLYAIMDNNERRPKTTPKEQKDKGLSKTDFKSMTLESFNALKDDELKKYLDDNDFPEKYDVKKVRELVTKENLPVIALAEYLEDAGSRMEDTEVKGAEVYLSKDEGQTWSKTHEGNLDGLYYTFGYYFGQIIAHPTNPQELYILGVPILKSEDGGKTWKNINGDNQHGDHHCLWINPKMPNHLVNGNDGGINISYDSGTSWIKCNMPPVGQFYTVNVDNEEVYNVYGGLQDNGVWTAKNTYKYSNGWQDDGSYPYKFLMGGDGMQVQIDNRDNTTVYTGSQFGNYSRINKKTKESKYITPKHDLGEKPYRWNWQTPILLSPHNQDILYMGCNKVLRSMDKGETFKELSIDLTKGSIEGDVPYGTLTTIDESILKFGLIYTGSDDGLIHVTKDGGNTWVKINDGLPQDLWVTRVQASKHKESRVYASLNGYRFDHFNAYLFVSDDYGATWTDLSKGLPNEPVNVVREDFIDKDLLYIGTDHGLYFSLDKGSSFMSIAQDLPRVAVHDLAIQKKANHLIIGTHGRSLYKLDLNPLKKLKEVKDKDLYLYEISKINYSKNWGRVFNSFSEVPEPKSDLTIFTKKEGNATIELQNSEGKVFYSKDLVLKKGIANYEVIWQINSKTIKDYEKWINKDKKDKIEITDADNKAYYPAVGDYKVVVKQIETKSSQDLKIAEKK